jgi:hypothetical protein
MKQYTFDADKVRRVAKRSSLRGFSRVYVKYLPLAAAAVMVLCVGMFALSGLTEKGVAGGGTRVIEQPSDSVTGRLSAAENALVEARGSKSAEIKTLYLSFGEGMTFYEMTSVFDYVSDAGNITVTAIFIIGEDEEIKCVSDPAEIEVVKRDKSARIVGAKIKASDNLLPDLIGQTEIIAVEPETARLNDANFVPLTANEVEKYEELHPKSATVATFMADDDYEPVETQNTEPLDTSADPVTGGTETSGETSDDGQGGQSGQGGGVGGPDVTGEHAETEKPEFVPVPHSRLLELKIANVAEAIFINDANFVTIGGGYVTLFAISERGDDSENGVFEVNKFEVNNYRKRFSESGGSLLVSSRDADGKRTKLYLADGAAGVLEEIDISHITDGGEMTFAFYDDVNGRIAVRVKGEDYGAIYLIDRGTYETREVVRAESDCIILALVGDTLYFSKTGEEGTGVCKYDMVSDSVEEEWVFDEPVCFERSADLKNFAANTSDGGISRVFIGKSGNVTTADETAGVLTFGPYDSAVLTDGERFYAVTENDRGALLAEITAEEAQGAFTGRNISSVFAIHEITPEGMKIRVKTPN